MCTRHEVPPELSSLHMHACNGSPAPGQELKKLDCDQLANQEGTLSRLVRLRAADAASATDLAL